MTLREQIRELRTNGKRAPKALQHEVVAHVEREERAGRNLVEVLDHLGVSRARYRYWQRKRGALVPAQFRPVLVREPVMNDARELVVEIGGVARVRGVRVAELAELLRALQ